MTRQSPAPHSERSQCDAYLLLERLFLGAFACRAAIVGQNILRCQVTGVAQHAPHDSKRPCSATVKAKCRPFGSPIRRDATYFQRGTLVRTALRNSVKIVFFLSSD